MGRGHKTNIDPPMKPPVDILAEVRKMQATEGGEGAPLPTAPAYCAREHSISFRLAPDEALSVGDTVHLGIEDPPPVISTGRVVGSLTAAHAHAMYRCVQMGYRMQGVVTDVDSNARTGTLLIAGEAARAA